MKCYSCQIFKKEGPPLRQSPKTTLLKIFFSRNCHHPLSRIGSDSLILEVMSIYTAITVTKCIQDIDQQPAVQNDP